MSTLQLHNALTDISELPYLSGTAFEKACVDILCRHLGLNLELPRDSNSDYDATRRATCYSSTEWTQSPVVIYQPRGPQQSPDIHVINGSRLLSIECKANETNSQPDWNQHIPTQDVLYLWNSGKHKCVFIRAGFQVIDKEEELAVRKYYAELKRSVKSMAFPSGQSRLNIALRYKLTDEQRDEIFRDSPLLHDEAIAWALETLYTPVN